MPRYFKVSRRQGSDRVSGFGIALRKEGEFFYVDHYEVAMNFRSIGWTVDEIEGKPTDGTIHEAAKTESFQNLINALEIRERTKPKGKWEALAPKGYGRIFVYGYDVRKPVVTEDHDVMVKFQDLNFTVKRLDGEPEKEPETNKQVEGEDKPKGRPLSTYDLPKSARAK